ncbi:hypothetical protein OR1_03637 [Geobacter sp. OR-1]|uniref:hypothetical protein n=1 Tax=Geobacter sp. OR-1 TaxID=1266765 RepID=UPI000543E2AE|nr:hypothetical protein [Geobacter sp. OR-1]GAM11324.1 hypothetical protein OR1_03637 [Geobacter sp. OR-1]
MGYCKTNYSNKRTECRRLAAHIAKAAWQMGLAASIEKSRVSASHYVNVYEETDANELKSLEIRCSDHTSFGSRADIYAWHDECPSITIEKVAKFFCRAIPPGFSKADYEARSATAKKAAATRRFNRNKEELSMSSAVAERLIHAKSTGRVMAGKILDEMYPNIPRAQRMRLADDAAWVVSRTKAIGTKNQYGEYIRFADRVLISRCAMCGEEYEEKWGGSEPSVHCALPSRNEGINCDLEEFETKVLKSVTDEECRRAKAYLDEVSTELRRIASETPNRNSRKKRNQRLRDRLLEKYYIDHRRLDVLIKHKIVSKNEIDEKKAA